ncbi:CAF17-like 4Fe-4S cluster assembly/insertion protein YgfZ [Crocosphaera sp.]|uniref:CAF17-like 4Fe-4S cluster assembly/insertion protein YgfZ n=1 Tax=Crocosphaera sp. TaxID=2729996 RepID=UPI003F1F7DD5|nr:folate-binding protein [Crocosphaera sp.]
MGQELRELQKKSGAILTEDGNIIESFGNDSQGFKNAYDHVVICDRSHWGLLQLTGEDRLRFLHNQTTNNINSLNPGQLSDTVFVNSTGRTLDLVTAYLTEDSIILLVSPNRRQFLYEWMDRYIFPMDKVEIRDISDQNAIFTIIGNQATKSLKNWDTANQTITKLSPKTHDFVTINDEKIIIGYDTGLKVPGYTLIVPENQAKTVWEPLINLGIMPIGDRVWEQLRIKQGRPYPDQELTEDYNPLEAGLWSTISFDKGCYIGQETIARLNTYQGVKQRLWGVKLNQLVTAGSTVTVDDNKVGTLTSCTAIEDEFIGLAYVKTKAGGEGLNVTIGDAKGELIAVTFLTHEYYKPD